MFTDKPLFIAPEVSSPDYAGRVRRMLSARADRGGSFSQALESQTEALNAAEEQRRNSVPAVSAARAVTGKIPQRGGDDAERRAGLSLKRWEGNAHDARQPGIALRHAGGMALDQRSLSVLQTRDTRKSSPARTVKKATDDAGPQGRLSARYESGSEGAAAIGYDRNGGTSYGTYQISSRQGTFASFLKFLGEREPAMAERLRRAGPPNTGSTRGGVPKVWKAIAEEQPERFEALQAEFIRDSHYNPALRGVRKALGVEELSPALQEVLWSTAVQHGPTGARRLFGRAAAEIAASGGDPRDEAALIDTVYTLRKGQFASSSPGVRAAVRSRFDDERRQALAMLRGDTALA
ncbi:MAG: hypothetical protein J1E80_07675 [Desulfovibrionaceae bacterium]|nr:hypothetical protein [Desulfovibrionaceae bacterium]